MIDPVERPSYGSLAAPAPQATESRRRSIVPWLIAAAALAFAVGLLANPWFERNVRAHLPGASTAADDSRLAALQARLDILEAARRTAPSLDPGTARVANQLDDVEDAQATVEQRLAELERQLVELRARSDASLAMVTQGVDRARTVLLVGSLRRALEGGQRIDAYEAALRARFGRTYPGETAALLALGRAPVTSGRLKQELDRLSPVIERAALDDANWWDSLRQGLASVVAVRRAGEPGMDPSSRLRFASHQLAAGNVSAAIAAMSSLPLDAQRTAAAWFVAARRYQAGMQALEALEIAALTPTDEVPLTAPTNL